MAVILHIETSTEVCSVTLAENGVLLSKKERTEGMNHSRLLTLFIQEIFSSGQFKLSDLDAVAVGKGPGSYTGLRIGVSVAKGLCYGLGISLIGINSLESMGLYTAKNQSLFIHASHPENTLFCPMIDARRMEVYTAVYDANGNEIIPTSAEIITADFLHEKLAGHQVLFFGNGAKKCEETIKHPNAVFAGPATTSAEFMQQLAYLKFTEQQFEDVAYFEPFYLKNFVATIPKNKILSQL